MSMRGRAAGGAGCDTGDAKHHAAGGRSGVWRRRAGSQLDLGVEANDHLALWFAFPLLTSKGTLVSAQGRSGGRPCVTQQPSCNSSILLFALFPQA